MIDKLPIVPQYKERVVAETYHVGPYGQVTRLRAELRADRKHLANAPLSKRERRQLENKIAFAKYELKQANALLRERQTKQKKLAQQKPASR